MWLKWGRRGSLSSFASCVSNEVLYVAQIIFWKVFVWLVPGLKAYKSDQQVEKHAWKTQFTGGKELCR